MAKLGEGSYADLTSGRVPTRVIVKQGIQGWEAEVFDFDGESSRGRHRVWGPEIHQDRETAARAAERAGRTYCNDRATVIVWMDFPVMVVPVPPPRQA